MTAYYRIYFDSTSGEPLTITWAKGDVRIPTREEDYATLPALSGRTADDTLCYEELAEDKELEQLLQTKKPVMDVTQDPPVLTWTDYPVDPEYDELADTKAALAELGVSVDE